MNKNTSLVTRIIVYVLLALSFLLVVFPLVYAFFGSFKSTLEFLTGGADILPQKGWRFQNYADAWKTAKFGQYTINSLLFSAFSVAGTILTTSMTGFALSRSHFKIKNLLIGSFGVTLFITGAITLFPIFQLCKMLGLTDNLFGMVIVQIAENQAVFCILVANYINGITTEIDEAARIDGCSFFRTYWNIILPIITPIIATVSILSFRSAWNNYMMPLVFTLTKPALRTLTVGVVALKDQGDGISAWNLMIAGTVISLMPMIVVYLFLNRYFIAGITEGSVKG